MIANDPFDGIVAEPPQFSAAEAVAIMRAHFGLEVAAEALVSERDQNFELTTSDGRKFVLKIANAVEDPVVTDFQIRALLHIASRCDESIAAPTILETKDGRSDFVIDKDGASHVARVVSYLPGVPMYELTLSAPLCRDLGRYLARLDLALGDFSHPGADQCLLWDMKRATEILALLPHVKDEDVRKLLRQTLGEFEACALPELDSLRWQVIHNDANPGNILATSGGDRIAGIIDFGDMLRSPLIIEVAVAAAYLRVLEGDPLALICEMLASYHSVISLTRAEIDILHELIKTRLATTVAILAWRESLRGKDDPYLQDAAASEQAALTFLGRLSEIPRTNAQQIYSQVCASVTSRR